MPQMDPPSDAVMLVAQRLNDALDGLGEIATLRDVLDALAMVTTSVLMAPTHKAEHAEVLLDLLHTVIRKQIHALGAVLKSEGNH